jgi:hypothetical protein
VNQSGIGRAECAGGPERMDRVRGTNVLEAPIVCTYAKMSKEEKRLLVLGD